MNTKVYKYCAVPHCHNTSIRTPEKLFVFVPHKKEIRDVWLQLASRKTTCVFPNTHLYFCEDHFDMPNDMENYIQYKIMGSVSQIRMKKGCVPTKFSCQIENLKRTSTTATETCATKKQRTSADPNHQEDSIQGGQRKIIEKLNDIIEPTSTTTNKESSRSSVSAELSKSEPQLAKMLIFLQNGEQRLITFIIPEESCTLQQILDQVKIPCTEDTHVQCFQTTDSEIDYFVAVGITQRIENILKNHPRLVSDRSTSINSSLKTKVTIERQSDQRKKREFVKEVNQSKASISTGPPLSQFIKGKFALCKSCGYNEYQQRLYFSFINTCIIRDASTSTGPSLSHFIKGKLSLCKSCGYNGQDLSRCQRCECIFTEEPQSVPMSKERKENKKVAEIHETNIESPRIMTEPNKAINIDFNIMKVCCACLSKNPSHWLINKTADAYTNITGIELTDEFLMMNQMCNSCIILLKQANDFRTICIESYKWLIKARKDINKQTSEKTRIRRRLRRKKKKQDDKETDINSIIIKEEIVVEEEKLIPEIHDRNKVIETDMNKEIVLEEKRIIPEENKFVETDKDNIIIKQEIVVEEERLIPEIHDKNKVIEKNINSEIVLEEEIIILEENKVVETDKNKDIILEEERIIPEENKVVETDIENIIIKEEIVVEEESVILEIHERNKFVEKDIYKEIVLEEERIIREENKVVETDKNKDIILEEERIIPKDNKVIETDIDNIIIKQEIVVEEERLIPEIHDKNKVIEKNINNEIVLEEERIIPKDNKVIETDIDNIIIKQEIVVEEEKLIAQVSAGNYRKKSKTRTYNYNAIRKSNIIRHEKPYKCDECQHRFLYKSRLVVHLNTHTGDKTYKCDSCNYSTAIRCSLIRHLKTHTGEKPYKCDTCKHGFSEKNKLVNHLRTHTGEKPYKCETCQVRFAQKRQLTVHMNRHTGDKKYECDSCNYNTALRANLERHLKTHTGEKPYKCDTCQHGFSDKWELGKHLRTHTGEKPYKCNKCNYCTAFKGNLIRHLKTHIGKKPHNCFICQQSFSDKANLDKHLLTTHTGVIPYKCDICQRCFSDKRQLGKHLKTHTGDKAYKCNICNHITALKRNLVRHLRTHTGQKEKLFKCDTCNYSALFKSNLARHIQRTHTGEKP